MKRIAFPAIIAILSFCISCNAQPATQNSLYTAFTGGNIFDGTRPDLIKDGVILIKDGKVVSVGPAREVEIPSNTRKIDVTGKYIIPGLINSHGHVGDVKGIEPGHYSAENIKDQLEIYAWYGITSVMSLGGDHKEAESFRAVNDSSVAPGRARLFIAGTIVTGNTPGEVDSAVDRNASMGVDIIKIRVDDNLGTTPKMPESIFQEVINRAHEHNLYLAVHLYYLRDAKTLLQDGADFIAHSIRDQQVDDEFVKLIKDRKVCYCPTLTRDLSTFVYEKTPDFFKDPFFRTKVDSSVIRQLEDPQFQHRIRKSKSAKEYKPALLRALNNLKILDDKGVRISMGTDTGVPTRFPGYFEHLEMEMMAEAGMSPARILLSATRNPAECLHLQGVGTLQPGNLADFIVLDNDPTVDIKNTRSISSVWIGGEKLVR